jgi:CheY-like chemotaxis protein
MLKRLFTPFDRLGAEHDGIEGSGIGLALSKRLVEAMGGSIRVQSAVGIGTTFAVEFPAAVAPDAEMQFSDSLLNHPLHDMPHAGQPEVPVRRQNVLQIEDNPANQQVIERVLGYRPHLNLITAIQGQMGLVLAREHHPEVILLDLNLPDLSGAEVLARLRADPQTAEIPVIIVSADATPNQVQRLLALGAQEYLTKPLNLEKLLGTLDRLTGAVPV